MHCWFYCYRALFVFVCLLVYLFVCEGSYTAWSPIAIYHTVCLFVCLFVCEGTIYTAGSTATMLCLCLFVTSRGRSIAR